MDDFNDFNLDAFFESESFNSLDAESKSLLSEFTKKASGKPQTDAAMIFMEYYGKLTASGKLDAPKRKLLMETLKAGLAPQTRKRLEIMQGMMSERLR